MMVDQAEQRIAHRVATDFAVEWIVPRRRMFRTVGVAEPARVVNLSLTGLGIVASPVHEVVAGSVVRIRCHDEEGIVRIIRVEADDENTSFYAAEFMAPDRGFLEALLSSTELAGRARLEPLWNEAF